MKGLSGKESCSFEGQVYNHGSEIYILRRLMICLNGKWHDKKLYGTDPPID